MLVYRQDFRKVVNELDRQLEQGQAEPSGRLD